MGIFRDRRAGAGEKRINLALQGGGAHGAFTWGVLDRLLEDGRIEIEGLSGASAGAMNAVVLAHGYTWAEPGYPTTQPTSLFRIASMSKPITSIASVMKVRLR